LLRELCETWFAAADTNEMPASEFLRNPELARLPMRDDLVALLKSIYGRSYVLYPNFVVRKDVYVGWHIDPAFSGPDRRYVWESDFLHVQCVIYLQDNGEEHGGGLDVIEGSHKPLLRFISGRFSGGYFGVQLVNRLLRTRRTLSLRAGDLVMWHARTVHRSTPARRHAKQAKYGIFFSTGQGDHFTANRFLSHMIGQRFQRINGTVRFSPRYAEILDLRYPDAFPPEIVEGATKHGIGVSTF
jgi:ectoine hydroxylase-related dioxygenase (phytanoyl-CoA dioxygenase family)